MTALANLDRLPTPVALPLKLFREAETAAQRIVAGADAGYSAVKFVALVRLSDWIREGMQRSPRVADLARFSRTLTGASCEDWWQLATALEADAAAPVAPPTPAWADRALRPLMQLLNKARFSRHSGAAQTDETQFAGRVDDAVSAILMAAAPLLRGEMARRQGDRREPCRGPTLPAGGPGDWEVVWRAEDGGDLVLQPFALVVAPEEGVQRDLYVYEKLTQRGYVFENTSSQFEVGHLLPLLERLRRWLQEDIEIRRRERGRQLESLEPKKLRSVIKGCLKKTLEKEWRIASAMKTAAHRPEVERALDRLAREGAGLLILTGPSGIGKTFELVRWLQSPERQEAGRVCLWIRAASWMGEDFEVMVGMQASGGEPATLPLDSLGAAAEGPDGRGLAVAIDGLNEAKDPDRLASLVVDAVKSLTANRRVNVQVVATARPEVVDRVLARVPAEWRTALDLGNEGVLALQPLPDSAARRLWDTSTVDTPRFDALPATVQRLLRVPMLSALARDARFEGARLTDAGSIVERFVEAQTSAFQRVLLRHLAVRMFACGSQVLTLADLEGAGPTAETVLLATRGGADAWGEAFADLVSQGLLVQHGSFPDGAEGGLSFGHDRILQWFTGRWLAVEHADTLREGRLSRLLEQVLGSTALSAAVGEAFALVHRAAPPSSQAAMETALQTSLHRGCASEPAFRELVAVRHAVRAWGESDPTTLDRWMNRAWRRSRWRRAARIELVSLAADVDHVPVLAHGLASWKSVREATVAVLSRVRLHNPDVLRAALALRWKEIRHPLLHPVDTITVLIALLYGAVAESGLAEPDEQIAALARTITRDLLGSGGGGRAMGRMVLRALVAVLDPFLDLFPQGPVNQTRELRAFLRLTRPAERARYEPLIRLFAGELRPASVRELALAVGTEGSWLPTVLLERGLMAASERSDEREEALDLAVAVGRAAQATTGFVPMAAEGMLYVLSEYLRYNVNRPTPAAWDVRFLQFRELARGWLARATERRWWSPLTGRRYKALFVAAFALLWPIRYGDVPCEEIRQLWEHALERGDTGLALDLVDDLVILALNEGRWGRALLELEPFLLHDRALHPEIMKRVAQLLGAIGERDAVAVSARLDRRLPGRNRVLVAEQMHIGRSRATLGNAFYQGFDRGLILNPRFRPTVRAVMQELLKAPSRRAWLQSVLRLTASELTGTPPSGGRQ